MDIIQRNFFRLLRSGAFNTTEEIEPMSAYKWQKLYQLSVMHDVVAYAYDGLERCNDQFFLRLPEKLRNEWQQAADKAGYRRFDEEEDEFLRPDHLTNPLLNHRLQDILDDESSDTTTRQMLLIIIRIVRHILNEGMPVRQLIELGTFIRQEASRIDNISLVKWIASLRLSQMSQLEGEFLVLLFAFDPEEIIFVEDRQNKRIEKIAQELIEFTNTRSQDWYFSQDSDSIFVHNSNTSAMLSHVRRSARYFRYYPSESLTNFFASFVHSLSHIEE